MLGDVDQDDVIGGDDGGEQEEEAAAIDAFQLGVPTIAHVKLTVADDGKTVIEHLVSNQRVTMPYEVGYEYDLVQVRDGGKAAYKVLCHGPDAGTKCHRLEDGLFSTKVVLTDDGFLENVLADGVRTKLLPEAFTVGSLYIPLHVSDGKTRLKAYLIDWSVPSIMWEARRLWHFLVLRRMVSPNT